MRFIRRDAIMTITLSNEEQVRRTVSSIMHDYTHATGIACVYADIRGRECSNAYNFTKFCKFIRSIPAFRDKCYQCDLCGGIETLKKQQCCPYRCHAGLVDFAVPIVKNNKIYGFIISGQMALEDIRIQYVQKPTEWQFDNNVKKYFQSIPKYSYEEVTSASRVLQTLVSCQFPYFMRETLPVEELVENVSAEEAEIFVGMRTEIQQAVRYIRKNLHGKLSLKNIAEEVYLSESYLSKLFKQEMKINLIQYINQCRIMEAEKILCSSKKSVDTVSRELGYHRTSYFCKIFKQHVGKTPYAYRKKSLDIQNNEN